MLKSRAPVAHHSYAIARQTFFFHSFFLSSLPSGVGGKNVADGCVVGVMRNCAIWIPPISGPRKSRHVLCRPNKVMKVGVCLLWCYRNCSRDCCTIVCRFKVSDGRSNADVRSHFNRAAVRLNVHRNGAEEPSETMHSAFLICTENPTEIVKDLPALRLIRKLFTFICSVISTWRIQNSINPHDPFTAVHATKTYSLAV